jgi:hypothetical protein
MNLDWKEVAGWLGWAVVAILTFMGRDVLKRLNHLEDTTVSKDDLDALETRLNFNNDRMHRENSKRLDGIETGTRGIHERIDDLYRDLINNRD